MNKSSQQQRECNLLEFVAGFSETRITLQRRMVPGGLATARRSTATLAIPKLTKRTAAKPPKAVWFATLFVTCRGCSSQLEHVGCAETPEDALAEAVRSATADEAAKK